MRVARKEGYVEFIFNIRWEHGADETALNKFQEIFDLIENEKRTEERDDLLKGMDFDSLRAFNLIGRRHFMLIGWTNSNKALQNLSMILTLGAAISVEVVPATEVHTFDEVVKTVKPFS
jgi:hypothetical protein